ncbi:hypothetical protein B0A55_00320 [Friedmanniomyces simplex]|uniref:Heterokaryon incompatibility domain-containing protein n=1 Tax=Friedmanniomyces simplex TaxID=329884 RepID=A0A4U0Y4J6_9PEZI|nr:hypothetical protein B0A55_00320 [Friedmanniomyces simplex]
MSEPYQDDSPTAADLAINHDTASNLQPQRARDRSKDRNIVLPELTFETPQPVQAERPYSSGAADCAPDVPIALRGGIYEPGRAYTYAESNESEPIVCKLTDVKRGYPLAYTAISYTWGDASKPLRNIICDGQAMSVTRNCHTVLSTLRRLGLAGPFWIDALCINQTDVLERNAQVAVMGDVFRDAPLTVVFLCEQDYDGVRAPVVSLPELEYVPGDANDLEELAEGELFEMYEVVVSPHLVEARKTRTILKPEIFYYSPWFTRTWIVQEVMLSQHLSVLTEHCHALVPWSVVSRAYEHWRKNYLLGDVPDIVLMRQPQDQPVSRHNYLNSIAGWARTLRYNTSAVSEKEPVSLLGEDTLSGTTPFDPRRLFDLLEATRHFRCSDPRDKLFALLPLFTGDEPGSLRPDYRTSAFALYRDLTWFFLQCDVPEILSLASLHHAYDGCSWIVNWADPTPQAQRLSQHHRGDGIGARWSAGIWPDRHGETKVHITRKLEHHLIVIRGRAIGTVDMRGLVVLGDLRSVRPRTRQHATKSGDMACVFLGFKTPFLLRRGRKWLSVVDEFEIEGVMEGQALADVDDGTAYNNEPPPGLEDFEIR